MVAYMRLRPGIVLHFTLHCFMSISLFVDNVEGSNYFVSVCITAWNNIVCYLPSPHFCGDGLYVEALGLSAAGELGGVGYVHWGPFSLPKPFGETTNVLSKTYIIITA